tara:strand:- start:1501 stop:1776 length:276 start_codon:yes stop_codon:yes gene_type:complete
MSFFEHNKLIEVSMTQNFETKFRGKYWRTHLGGGVPLIEVLLTEQNFSCCFLYARKISPKLNIKIQAKNGYWWDGEISQTLAEEILNRELV